MFIRIAPHLLMDLELHPQRLEEALGVGQLLPLELHLTLQPGDHETQSGQISLYKDDAGLAT